MIETGESFPCPTNNKNNSSCRCRHVGENKRLPAKL